MKSLLFLIPAIFATTAALADAQTAMPPKPADAHVQAAALLSRPHTPETVKLERSSSVSEMAIDAHASAAALLIGHRIATSGDDVACGRRTFLSAECLPTLMRKPQRCSVALAQPLARRARDRCVLAARQRQE